MSQFCARCRAAMTCDPTGTCWCLFEEKRRIDRSLAGCLCPRCLAQQPKFAPETEQDGR